MEVVLENGCVISDDPARLDVDLIHRYLSQESYWAKGIPRALAVKSIAHSLPFGIYLADGSQVGFARVITDRATFAYLADVFVLPPHRGLGLTKGLMETIGAHPDLQGLRRWLLATQDAHGLYRRYGFQPLSQPERLMERRQINAYLPDSAPA